MISEQQFVERIFLALGIVALAFLAWQVVDVLLLVFASILIAILFRASADVIHRYSPLNAGWALAFAVLIILSVAIGSLVLFGTQLSNQIGDLLYRLPAAWHAVQERLGQGSWLRAALERVGTSLSSGGNILDRVSGAVSAVATILTNVILVLFASLYLATQPELYLGGALRLVPPRQRERLGTALRRCGRQLRHWIIGQLIAMLLVGTLTTLGLMLLGVPSALALGLVAGLTEFVPVVGPIAGAIPALLIALSQDTLLALWVLLLFIAIQQIEGNLIQPVIQRQMVALPPVVTLFAVVAAGFLFGPLGVLLATPLAVVCLVLIQDLYVADIEAGE